MSKYYNYGDAQYRASQRYEKKTIKRIVVKLNKNTDAELIEYIEGIENVQGWIKNLMLKYMDSNK